MAAFEMWKLLHLLNTHGPTLSRPAVRKAGITCDPDTLYALVSSGSVEALPPGRQYDDADDYRLSSAATCIMQNCLVGNRRRIRSDIRVGDPLVFVVMPFREDWSSSVYSLIIEPAVISTGMQCLRGDSISRAGDLVENLLDAICRAGLVVVDISAPNPNVYYELGLCQALGRETVLLKQAGVVLPADLAGAHYHEYTLDDVAVGRTQLVAELRRWIDANDLSLLKAEKA